MNNENEKIQMIKTINIIADIMDEISNLKKYSKELSNNIHGDDNLNSINIEKKVRHMEEQIEKAAWRIKSIKNC